MSLTDKLLTIVGSGNIVSNTISGLICDVVGYTKDEEYEEYEEELGEYIHNLPIGGEDE